MKDGYENYQFYKVYQVCLHFSFSVPMSHLQFIFHSSFSFLRLNITLCPSACAFSCLQSVSMIEFHLVYCQWAIFLQFFQNRKYTCWSDVDQIFTSFLVRSPWFIDYRSNGGSKQHWIDFFLEAARCSISLAFLICVFFSSFLHFLGIYSNHKHMAWLYYIACFLGICTHWINIACLIYICFMLFFSSIFQMLQRFAIVGLSNFYLDVAKDRLYVGYGLYFIFIHHLMIRIHNLMM